MRYCDKCGAVISRGGHKSCASGIFGTPIICDSCYDKEVAAGAAVGKAALSVGKVFFRLFVGILVGLGSIIGVCTILNSVAGGLPDATQVRIVVGVEVAALICFIASKIGTYFLRNRLFKFLLRIVSYFTFWMALVLGIGLYFIIKFAI